MENITIDTNGKKMFRGKRNLTNMAKQPEYFYREWINLS